MGKARNKCCFDKGAWDSSFVCRKAVAEFHDYNLENSKPQRTIVHHTSFPFSRQSVTWEKPPCGVVKVNVDAGLSSAHNCAGSGALAMYHNGPLGRVGIHHVPGIS